jgi:hypothetical protein
MFGVKISAMKLIFTLFFLVVAGCQSVNDEILVQPQGTVDLHNSPAIQKAEFDLAIAIESGAEWQVRDPSTGENPVRLSLLLQQARVKFENGDDDEANRIASRVSMLVRLALVQQRDNRSSIPDYQHND